MGTNTIEYEFKNYAFSKNFKYAVVGENLIGLIKVLRKLSKK